MNYHNFLKFSSVILLISIIKLFSLNFSYVKGNQTYTEQDNDTIIVQGKNGEKILLPLSNLPSFESDYYNVIRFISIYCLIRSNEIIEIYKKCNDCGSTFNSYNGKYFDFQDSHQNKITFCNLVFIIINIFHIDNIFS